MTAERSPLPFELIKANEHHGAYIVNGYGSDVCDFYAMSDPSSASVRNGGDSKPIPFVDADGNAEFMWRAANAHDALVAALGVARVALEDAAEELRLIRMKDCGAVYDVMLRNLTIPLALSNINDALALAEVQS